MMKRRLRLLSLAAMKVALTRQQTFTKEIVAPHNAAAFDEVCVMTEKYALDQIGMIEQIDFLLPYPEMDYITVRSRQAFHKSERIALVVEI